MAAVKNETVFLEGFTVLEMDLGALRLRSHPEGHPHSRWFEEHQGDEIVYGSNLLI